MKFLIICLVFLPSYTYGKIDGVSENSTLSDLLTYAELNNPGLKAAYNEWIAAVAKVTQARSLPNPQFTFAYFVKEIETRVGPQRNRIGIMQMFPWFGKLRLKGKSALLLSEAVRKKFENMRFTLHYRVKETFFKYYYTLRNLSILEENLRLLTYLESVTQAKYKTGKTIYADLIKIRIELEKIRDQVRSKKELLTPLKARLNAVLNRSSDALLPIPKKIPIQAMSFTHDQLAEWVKENNPQIKSLEYLEEKEEIGVRLAKKSYFPDFSLGLDYLVTAEAAMPGISDSGKDPLIVMAQIRLPLWFARNRALVNQAKARFQSASNQRKERENSLLAHVEMVYYQFQDAQKQTVLYRESLLPQARQSLQVTQSAYISGTVDILNLIDAQRILLALELVYEQAVSTFAQKLAELEMYTGKSLSTLSSLGGMKKDKGREK